MTDKLRSLITSPIDRETTVVELWLNDAQFAEIRPSGDTLTVEIYNYSDHEWTLDLTDLQSKLKNASQILRPTSQVDD